MRSPRCERLAQEVGRLERRAQVELDRAVEAQELLDGGGRDFRVGPPVRQLVGVGEQGQQPVAEQVRRGLEAGGEEEDGRRRHLLVGQTVVVLPRPRPASSRGRRVGALDARRAARGSSRRGCRGPRWRRRSPPRSARARSLAPPHGPGAAGRARSAAGTPTNSPMTAIGQREGEVGHELDLARRRPGRSRSSSTRVWIGRAQPVDLAGGERPRDETPQACVIRRIGQEHVVLRRGRGTRPAGCPSHRRCRSTCPRRRCPDRGEGRAARPGTPRSR